MVSEPATSQNHFHSGYHHDGEDSIDGKVLRGILQPSDDPASLGRLGTYEVTGVVGVGGMAVVLKAVDPTLDRTVAIKVLAPNLAASGIARKRFSREAKAAAAIVHPNVIAIYSVVNEDTGIPYLVMPYIRGQSLQRRIESQGTLDVREILRIASQVASGLTAAHAQGLTHRDIKPANILLDDGVERVTLTDFGLARAIDDASLTYSSVIAGTPSYMSPEQVQGDTLDHRSDLHSLGSVLYAMCTGKPPYQAETTYGVMKKVCENTSASIRSQNPDIPDWLETLIVVLMSKEPGKRIQSAQELENLFKECLAHLEQPNLIPLPKAIRELQRRTNSAKSLRLFVAALAPLLLVGILIGWWTYPSQSPEHSSSLANASNLEEPTEQPLSPANASPQVEDRSSGSQNTATSVTTNGNAAEQPPSADLFRFKFQDIVNVSKIQTLPVLDPFRLDLMTQDRNFPSFSGKKEPGGFSDFHSTDSLRKRNALVVFEIDPIREDLKLFPEIGREFTVTMTDGTTAEYRSMGSTVIRSLELERKFPKASFLDVYNPIFDTNSSAEVGKATELSVIRGELLLCPGATYKFIFEGSHKQTKTVRNQTFTLESIESDIDGVVAKIRFPIPKLAQRQRTPQEIYEASVVIQSAYDILIEDDLGGCYIPTGMTDRDALGNYSFRSYRENSPDGNSGGSLSGGNQFSLNPVLTIDFGPLSKGRKIKSLHVTFKDRTGLVQSVPFELKLK